MLGETTGRRWKGGEGRCRQQVFGWVKCTGWRVAQEECGRVVRGGRVLKGEGRRNGIRREVYGEEVVASLEGVIGEAAT